MIILILVHRVGSNGRYGYQFKAKNYENKGNGGREEGVNASENLGAEAVGIGNRFAIYVVLVNKEKSM